MVTGAFYPEISGAGLQCRTLINSLKNNNLKFFVLTTAGGPSLRDSGLGIDIFRIYAGNMGFIARLRSALNIIYIFLKIQNKIDIVHIHGFSDKSILIILLARAFRKKIIQKMTSLGEDDPDSIFSRRFGMLKRFFFSRADVFISVNPVMSRAFIEAGLPESRLLTIPNGVDIERFCPPKNLNEKTLLRKELGLPEDGILILFVGFFSKDKGPDILFESFKNLKGRIKEDLFVIFIGATEGRYFEIDANLVKTIKDGIAKFNMQNTFIFVESTLKIEKYYKASDIFIFPSLREGLPNALLEAMSTALSCVSSDLKGVTDYLISDKKEGLIFAPGDIEGLRKAICTLLNDKNMAEELGRNARRKILDKFSIDKVSRQYQYIYDKLAKDNKC